MCLDQVYKKRDFIKKYKIAEFPRMDVKVGCKVIIKVKGGYCASRFVKPGAKFSCEQWLHEKDFRKDLWKNVGTIETTDLNNRYKIGFHILLSLEDAKTYAARYDLRGNFTRIVKVYFMDACAYGIQDWLPIVVSKKIYIPQQIPYGSTGRKCRKEFKKEKK